MSLEKPTKENLATILQGLSERLGVVNRSLMDPDDYDLDKYDELKFMYDTIMQKGHLSASETKAFIEELRAVRKN